VQVVGTLLVTALLVTPAATAQQVGRSFRSCLMYTQAFGISSVVLGLYFSAELDTGSGSMIALVSAVIFTVVVILANASWIARSFAGFRLRITGIIHNMGIIERAARRK